MHHPIRRGLGDRGAAVSFCLGIAVALGVLLSNAPPVNAPVACRSLELAADGSHFVLNASSSEVPCISFSQPEAAEVGWAALGGPVTLLVASGPYGPSTSSCSQVIAVVYSSTGTAGSGSFNASATLSGGCFGYRIIATEPNSTSFLVGDASVDVALSWGAS